MMSIFPRITMTDTWHNVVFNCVKIIIIIIKIIIIIVVVVVDGGVDVVVIISGSRSVQWLVKCLSMPSPS